MPEPRVKDLVREPLQLDQEARVLHHGMEGPSSACPLGSVQVEDGAVVLGDYPSPHDGLAVDHR